MYGIVRGIPYSLYYSIDDLNTRESEELFRALGRIGGPAVFELLRKTNSAIVLTLGQLQDPRARLLDSFDTHSDLKLNAYRLQGALPQAYFVTGVRHAPSRQEAAGIFIDPAFPSEREVILEEPRITERPGVADMGKVKILSYENQQVRCEVQAMAPGFLVLLDSYYPGWCAYVDGERAEILRANYAFRAVAIPAGNHEVCFRYRPLSFSVGSGVTLATLLLLLVGIVPSFRRRDRA